MGKERKNDKGNNIVTVFILSQRLMRGNRGRLYFLLATLVLFNFETALMMPFVMKCGFGAVLEGDMQALFGTAVGAAGVFAFNFAVMYFLNVYGDAWVTKFAFHAAKNCFRELSSLPVASVQAAHNDDDLFNRIAAGTGNIMGFYFSLVDLLGNGAAVAVLAVMLCRFSGIFGGVILLLVAAELFFVCLQFRYNAAYTGKLQKDKEEGIRRVRSLLEQLSFHQYNQTWDWMRRLYEEARGEWFLTQEKKTMTGAVLDACLLGVHGIFKTGIVYSFMVKQGILRSYVDDVASSFSTFNNLAAKTKGFGGSISRLPNVLVPIGRLDAVLTGRPQRTEGGQEEFVLEHVSVAAGGKEILKNVCCRIPEGSRVAVIGENGSGKSTLLKAMAGLYQCVDGKVHGLGRRITYIPADDLLFQGHSVKENISYSKDEAEAEVIKGLLEELRFHNVEELCEKNPEQLSGGEAKRINIARGLFSEAEVILADEPTSSLDQETAGRVMELLLGLEGRTVIYITHDPKYVLQADQVICIQDGEIRQIIKGDACAENAYFRSWSQRVPAPRGRESSHGRELE